MIRDDQTGRGEVRGAWVWWCSRRRWWALLALSLWGGCSPSHPSQLGRECAPSACVERDTDQVIERARKLAAAGQTHLAEQLLQAALGQGAPPERVLPSLLRVCLADGRLQRALDYAETALGQGVASGELHFLVASMLWALERFESAERHAELALRPPEAHQEAWLLLGDLALRSRNPERARYCFGQLVNSEQPELRARARAALTSLGEAPPRPTTEAPRAAHPRGTPPSISVGTSSLPHSSGGAP